MFLTILFFTLLFTAIGVLHVMTPEQLRNRNTSIEFDIAAD